MTYPPLLDYQFINAFRAINHSLARSVLNVYTDTIRRSLNSLGGYECQVRPLSAESAPARRLYKHTWAVYVQSPYAYLPPYSCRSLRAPS